MTEAALTLFGVIAGSIITLYLAALNHRNQTQKELQDYRKSLMQQYLECIQRFDELLAQMKSESLVYILQNDNTPQPTFENALNMVKYSDELRSLIIRASSLLKATGDTELIACGWVLYQEALDNIDKTGVWFKTKEYNPISYFRITMDFGLSIFAETIANNKPPSKIGYSMELNETLKEQFRETMAEKYKKDINWANRLTQEKDLANRLIDEAENSNHDKNQKSEEA